MILQEISPIGGTYIFLRGVHQPPTVLYGKHLLMNSLPAPQVSPRRLLPHPRLPCPPVATLALACHLLIWYPFHTRHHKPLNACLLLPPMSHIILLWVIRPLFHSLLPFWCCLPFWNLIIPYCRHQCQTIAARHIFLLIFNDHKNGFKGEVVVQVCSFHPIPDTICVISTLILSLRTAGVIPDTPLAAIPHD